MDYGAIGGLRLEARQKLAAIRPLNIGQASRISGVSPADIAVLLIWLEQDKAADSPQREARRMKVKQFVMAYGVDHDRLRAILPWRAPLSAAGSPDKRRDSGRRRRGSGIQHGRRSPAE